MNKFESTGARIAEVRGPLTKQEFATRLEVDRKTVERWEAGERLPDGSKLLRLLTEFGADVNYVLIGTRNTPDQAGALQSVAAAMARVSPQAALPRPPGALEQEYGGTHNVGTPSRADETQLLDAYRAADDAGRAALLTVAQAVARRN